MRALHYLVSKLEHTSELFKSTKILDVFKLNIFNIVVFMHKSGWKSVPSIFILKFRKPSQSYPTRFSHLNYVKTILKLNKCKYEISYRGPLLVWNIFLNTMDEQNPDNTKFKAVSKSKLPSLESTIIVMILNIVTRNNIVWKLLRGYCLCYCKTFSLVPGSTECTKSFITEKCST